MRPLRWLGALTLALSAAGCGSAAAPGTPGAATTPSPTAATSQPSAGTPASSPVPSSPPAAVGPSSPSGAASPHPGAPSRAGYLTGISVGRHATFDRVVFHFAHGIPAYRIRYVPKVPADPRGDVVPLAGQAFMRVVFHHASGHGTYSGPRTVTPLFPTLLQVRAAGDFEGYLSFGIGLSQRVTRHAFTLTRPYRVILDVAHSALPPFPGIWDITSWHQFWGMQAAFIEGHQPWLADPRMVVQAWAAGNMTNPGIRQTAPDTFEVTEPGTGEQATVSGTRPVTAGTAQLWVITKITYD